MPPKKYKSTEGFMNGVSSGAQTRHIVHKSMLRGPLFGHVYFRGDGRSPNEVFADGFQPREQSGIIYRTMHQDIDPASAVCVSASIDVAALFPISDRNATSAMIKAGNMHAPQQTTVYIVCPREVFNTERLQQRFAANQMKDQGVKQQTQAKLNVYAKERATTRIEPDEVIAAVQVVRQWAGSDYLDGGLYTIIGCTINPGRAARFERAGHIITALGLNRALESGLGGTCRLPVARDMWERVLDDEDGEFRRDVWEEVLLADDGAFADLPVV